MPSLARRYDPCGPVARKEESVLVYLIGALGENLSRVREISGGTCPPSLDGNPVGKWRKEGISGRI